MSENMHIKSLRTLIGKRGKDISPSPYMQWLDGMLIAIDEGYAELKFAVRKNMLNPAGIVHGGVLAGMIDEAAGISVYSLQKEYFYTTLNLSIDYLRPAHRETDLLLKSEVIRHGNRIIHVEVRLFQDEKLKAKATSNLILLKEKIPQTFEPSE